MTGPATLVARSGLAGLSPERAGGSVPIGPSARDVWREIRGWLIVAAIIIVVGTMVGLLQRRIAPQYLDPHAADRSGSRALAQILGQRGVSTKRVASVEAAGTAVGPQATLLVTRPHFLADGQLDELSRLTVDIVIVEPSQRVLDKLAPAVDEIGEATVRSREPKCALPAASRAGSADTGGYLYRAPAGGVGCYSYDGEPSLVRSTVAGRTVTVVGAGRFMTNDHLAQHGNAALAMNLLGGKPMVVWLVPDPGVGPSSPQEEKSIYELIPDRIWWAVLMLFIGVALIAAWRMRRLGRVVSEAIPVVVRAAETVEGRGRLYRARRARDRAAAALRTGVLDRTVPRLGLPADATPQAVAAAVAARTGRQASQVAAALYGPSPENDVKLIALTEDLDTLERQVRQS